MKLSNGLFRRFLLVALSATSMQAPFTQAGEQVRADNPPVLSIYKKKNNDQTPNLMCQIPMVTDFFRFARHPTDPVTYPDCISDEAYEYKITNAPATTLVYFYDDRNENCSSTNQLFWFEVRVSVDNYSMPEPRPLKELGPLLESAPWVPVPGADGLHLMRGEVKGQIEGKLSCVRMKMPTSPTP